MANTPQYPSSCPDVESHSGEVGALLRETRESSGQDLRTVVGALRIRRMHILAIEEGRYDALPGATYAVGFVRAYAEYLGLDGNEIIRRFRNEDCTLSDQNDLSFPVPVNEGGMPSGALIGIAVLLTLLVYGGWYVSTATDTPLVSFIQNVPDRFSDLLGGDDLDPIPARDDFLENPGPLVGTPPPPLGNDMSADISDTALNPLTVMPSIPDASLSDTATPLADESVDTDTPQADHTQDVIPPPENADEEYAVEDVTAKPPQTTNETTNAERTAPKKVTDTDPVVPSADRVRIVAKAESWIQIRGENGVVASRLLRQGEHFDVPAGENLTLRTGNAGGTLIVVDGKELPPLGKMGQVVSGVSLTPSALLTP